jgi:hypothetical protein
MNKDFLQAFGAFDNGFTLSFENGLVLSTRFGDRNYCDNNGGQSQAWPGSAGKGHFCMLSDTAEVGIWENDEKEPRVWINGWQTDVFGIENPSDDVKGYVTIAEWSNEILCGLCYVGRWIKRRARGVLSYPAESYRRAYLPCI